MLPVDDTRTMHLEAAAFRRLVAHLQTRTDVQNIDLMNLAGFCRNCLANWIEDAARTEGLAVDKEAARTHVYGMPQAEWRACFQSDATAEQQHAFSQAAPAGEATPAHDEDRAAPVSRNAEA